jgi:hypothetical protein
MRRQVAYRLEPRPLVPAPRRLADNGVAEVLAVSDRELLVLERGGAQQADGTWRFAARLFLASVASASEVGGMAALPAASFTPASKRLLLELGTAAGERVDNLEGLAWGRVLPNGRRSLVLVSDDNFSVSQQTQFWVFEVQP